MNIFLLAAGLGARLRPLTHKLPKPCLPFLNVPLGYYQFRFLQDLQITTCVANSFHLPEQIEQLYKTQPYIRNDILFSKESGSILGSSGGLKKASAQFSPDETILMMNVDEVFFTHNPRFIHGALEQHLANNNLATLIVMKHPDAGEKFGAIWCSSDKKVKKILPAKTKPDEGASALSTWHYIGIILLNKRILPLIPENRETNIFYDILTKELAHNSVEAYPIDCSWFETGNPKDYLAATQKTLEHLDKETLTFINGYDPSRLIQNNAGISLISESVKVSVDCLKGYNVIGKSTNPANLTSLKVIENSVLFDNEILNAGYFT